jgi:hypothetical protein
VSVAAKRGAVSSNFGYAEWHRLSGIATKYEPKMRVAYTRAIRDGRSVDKLELRQVITGILAEIGRTTAPVYGLVFNPNSPIYIETIDRLVEKFESVVDSQNAREEVRRILPTGLSLGERRERLNTFGLDTRSAIRLEKYRQELGDSLTAQESVRRARQDAIRTRGNTLATTEVNRAVNSSLEALWIDNMGVSKATYEFFDRSISNVNNLPRTARKEWITRRDGRVCLRCQPLDGLRAKIGEDFDTEYGFFLTPPIHPHCRCFVIVSSR